MTRRVRFSQEAMDDLETIEAYIARNNPSAASQVIIRIRKLIGILAEHPFLGRHSEVEDAYKMPVGTLSYLVVYEAREKELWILRVYHGSRDISY